MESWRPGGYDAPRKSAIVRRLIARQLVNRKGKEDDKRIRLVRVSTAGAEVIARVGARIFEYSPVLGGLTQEECDQLEQIMLKLNDAARQSLFEMRRSRRTRRMA